MSRTLTAYVHVVDETGLPVVLAPGDELSDEYADQVTNPKAFVVDVEETETPAPKKAPAKKAASRPARGKATTKPDPAPPATGGTEDGAGAGSRGDGDGGDSSGEGAGEAGGSQQ